MTGQSYNSGGVNEDLASAAQEHGSLKGDSCACGKEAGACGCGAEGSMEGDSCGCGGGSCGCGGHAEAKLEPHAHAHAHAKMTPQVQEAKKPELIEEVNSKRPETKEDPNVNLALDPLFAPYHRTTEEAEKMPVIEKTMSVCPECKLIIPGNDLQGRGLCND